MTYPKYIVVCLQDNKVVMATHQLFPDFITASEYAVTINSQRTAIVVEVLKPLYEGEEKQ